MWPHPSQASHFTKMKIKVFLKVQNNQIKVYKGSLSRNKGFYRLVVLHDLLLNISWNKWKIYTYYTSTIHYCAIQVLYDGTTICAFYYMEYFVCLYSYFRAISNKMANIINQSIKLTILVRSTEVMYASIRYKVHFHT